MIKENNKLSLSLFQLLTIFLKRSILDDWQGSKYTCLYFRPSLCFF